MRPAKDLSCSEIVELVQSVQDYLYLDLDEQGRPTWNPEKTWSGDEFDFIAGVLKNHGLTPVKSKLAQQEIEQNHYVLFDVGTRAFSGGRVFDDFDLAAEYARELDNVIVVPVLLPQPTTAEFAKAPDPCECQSPGDFCSGVPGILAHVKDCRVDPGGKVERCDLCQRYASDQAAYAKLVELGMV